MKFNTFIYTKNTETVVDVELPGVDPKDVRLSYSADEGRIYLNDVVVVSGILNKYLDITAAKAELKNGLLRVVLPQKKPTRLEIPINVNPEAALDSKTLPHPHLPQ
jgi:HSP20 family molecular chaperone IbpA